MIPAESKYLNDAEFHTLVDSMEAFIHHARYTPSEMREAAMLASIHFEIHTTKLQYPPTFRFAANIDGDIHQAIGEYHTYLNTYCKRSLSNGEYSEGEAMSSMIRQDDMWKVYNDHRKNMEE